MKVRYRNILVSFLAAILFFVGAGVTVVDLCCSACVEDVKPMSPHPEGCSMKEIKTVPSTCCTQNTDCVKEHTGRCCVAKRISIDLDYSSSQPSLLQSIVWTIVPCFISCIHTSSHNNELLVVDETRDPIPIPPRNYLSLIRVLII